MVNESGVNMGNDIIIRAENLKRDFVVGAETVRALRGVSFDIRQGEFVSIMGTSGSGKSTLLNILGCLDKPTSGEYYIDGIGISQCSKDKLSVIRNRKIGFVFQSYNLLARTTAIENVELPLLYNHNVSSKERRELAEHALEMVGLSNRRYHMPVRRAAAEGGDSACAGEQPGHNPGGRGDGQPRHEDIVRDNDPAAAAQQPREDDSVRHA